MAVRARDIYPMVSSCSTKLDDTGMRNSLVAESTKYFQIYLFDAGGVRYTPRYVSIPFLVHRLRITIHARYIYTYIHYADSSNCN